MNYKKILEFLYNAKRDKIQLGLERIESLLSKIGSPHINLNVIHVAGTNGKGSVCAMISSILQEAGYNVGVYTSPHLVNFTERFMINNEQIDKKEVERLFEKIKPHITEQTFFEITTAMAFLYFYEKKVDFCVLEAGMGGKYDATNVVVPLISVITNVTLDHREYLGKNIMQIAGEKAGIIKENGVVVTSAEGEGLEVIRKECIRKNASLYRATPTGLRLGLKGEFQRANGGTAIKAIKKLKHYNIHIPKIAIINGLENAKWPGRFDFRIIDGKTVIFDCAHNPHGFSCLANEINILKKQKSYDMLHLVFGAMKDKNIKEMISQLEDKADTIILTKASIERAELPKNIAKYIKKNTEIIESPKQALKKAVSIANKDDVVLVCGSCYLVGDVLKE